MPFGFTMCQSDVLNNPHARLPQPPRYPGLDMKPELLDPGRVLDDGSPLTVGGGVVHVWYFSTETAPGIVDHCLRSLSAEERARAGRFVFEHHRQRFVTAHGVLRHLLSRYCGTPALRLEFTTRSEGKPVLQGAAAQTRISFNMAHSGNRALAAVGDGRELGADLEKIRPMTDLMEIAQRYFHGSEYLSLDASDPARRHPAFFRLWVAKEAVLKAQGIGLGYPLDQFQVPLGCESVPMPIVTIDPERLEKNWHVRQIDPGEGWAAAICAAGTDWILETPGA